MACSGAYATAEEFQQQWFYDFEDHPQVDVDLDALLLKSAGRIHAALAASGQCDCALAAFAAEYLKELNLVAAAVMFNIAAVRLSSEQRTLYNEYLAEQLTLIRNGELELCEGETAKQTPTFGVAQYALTDRAAAQIIVNRRRSGGL